MYLKNINIFISLSVVMLLCSNIAWADSQLGAISGEIDYCNSGGKVGLRVSILGRQASIITGSDGKFIFESLAPGEYSLGMEFNGVFIGTKEHIIVKPNELNQLGKIAVCNNKADANASQALPEVNSSAALPTHCQDGYHGQIKVENGTAQCDNGEISQLNCAKEFADCDKDLKNGCEVNLQDDNDNCGRCGNACPAHEFCVLGSC